MFSENIIPLFVLLEPALDPPSSTNKGAIDRMSEDYLKLTGKTPTSMADS